MLTATQFYNKYIGKGYDIDGVAGKQCVDLWKIFCQEYFGSWKAAGGTGATAGYACQYWITHRTQSWITDHFKVISGSSNLQDGDWCFWAYGSKDCPYSHVAMYYQGKFFGMNQGSKNANLVSISKSGMLGHFRPKCYITSSSTSSSTGSSTSGVKSPTKWNKAYSKGVTFTVIPDVGLILRKGAGKSYGKIVTMPKGTKVKYYGGYGGSKGNWWIYVAVTVNGKSYEGWCKGSSEYLKGYID